MELFELDRSRCVKCALCVKDCFFGALKTGEDGFPSMVDPEKCMRCQHCLAICPKGAVTFNGKQPEDSLPVEGLAVPSIVQMENYMRVRRSVRRYRDCDVERQVLERIFKALGNSPTGCNARNLKFTCFATRKAMDEFREKFIRAIEEHRDGEKLLPRWLAVPAIQMRKGRGDMFFRGASGMVIISSDETAPGVTTPDEDVVIACSYFEMLAQASGLGTCWCGFLKLVQREIPELLVKTLGFRPTTSFYAVLFGLPAITYQRGVQRDGEAVVDWRE
ncbi:MAG: nitroreductase family protein [Kiritimatiellae bacterium]|nr:nitroreductase family protein [Kiritimatiellia bacterium]